MPEPWTGELIGKMHNAGVSYEDLARECGCTKAYISMILNGKRSTAGAQERLNGAFQAVMEKRHEKS